MPFQIPSVQNWDFSNPIYNPNMPKWMRPFSNAFAQGTAANAQQQTADAAANQTRYQTLQDLINKATNPALTNSLYNTATENVRRAQGGAVGSAQAAAGAYGASRGLLNRGNFVQSAGSQARAQYAPVFGQVEQSRANALAGLAKEAFEMQMLLDRIKQGDKDAEREYKLRLDALSIERQKADYATQEAGWEDYLGLGVKAVSPFAGNIWDSTFGKKKK